jgi:methionyl-tRNA formyltransferase
MPAGVDLIVTAHSHDFVGRATRLKARHGALGYHPSLLPRHRGRSSIDWAIRFGERITGGTVYWLTDTVDGGPIAAQEACHIPAHETPLDLWARELAPMGLRLFRRVLREIDAGVVVAVDQDNSLATWEPSIDNLPRLFRPDLPMLGGPANVTMIRTRDGADTFREGVA